MSRFSEMSPCNDVHDYLVAFCALAMELYPEDDWSTVEPKLEQSWKRYLGDGMCRWSDVRDSAHTRWEARSASTA